MSRIAAQYSVTEISNDVVRKEVVHESVRDANGKHVGFKPVVREKKGGYFYKFPNGNSITLDKPADGPAAKMMDDLSNLSEGDEVPMGKRISKNQLEVFGLTSSPRLVDMTTGEEVDERGVPLSLAQHVSGVVVPSDMPLEFQGNPKASGEGIDASIAALED